MGFGAIPSLSHVLSWLAEGQIYCYSFSFRSIQNVPNSSVQMYVCCFGFAFEFCPEFFSGKTLETKECWAILI